MPDPSSEPFGRQEAPRGLIGELRALYRWLPDRRRRQLRWLGGLVVLNAILESLTIALLVPFLAVITIGQGGGSGKGTSLGSISGLPLGEMPFREAAFCLAALFVLSGIVGVVRVWLVNRVTQTIGHEIGVEIYRRTLSQPYGQFVQRNSSETLGALDKVNAVTAWVLVPVLNLASAVVMAVLIAAVLIAIQPAVSIGAFLVLGLSYFALARFTRKRLGRISETLSATYGARIKSVQEGLGGIRDVILDRSEGRVLEEFRRIDARYRTAQTQSRTLGAAPRYALEAFALAIVVTGAALLFTGEGGSADLLPAIGALAYGLRRLMPLGQQVFAARTSFASYAGLMGDLGALMRLPLREEREDAPVPSFRREVRFAAVDYGYGKGPAVFRGLDLVVPAGARIGLMGPSGAGKSTLIDLFAGLLEPDGGEILIDGVPLDGALRRGWQRRLAYVPQSVFLTDDTIARNIAFGARGEALDRPRVEAAARAADLLDTISRLPDGLDTPVGERGARLSGGQRQRIGIARALYRRPDVLLLDEATSALDEATEENILSALGRLDRRITVLSIAHRRSSLRHCDTIYEVSGAGIRELPRTQERA